MMRSYGIPEDYIKMKAFPFSLDGVAKDWLYLQPDFFNTWDASSNEAPDLEYGKQHTVIWDQGVAPSSMVNEVGAIGNLRLENHLIELTSLIITTPRGNVNVVSLRSDRELPQQAAPQQRPRPTDAEFEPDADSPVPQQAISVPLPFPTQTLSTRKAKIDEDLLKMFQEVEINIPLLDAIKQIPKYAKFLKELCVHKSKKMNEGVELGGVMLALTKNEVAIGSDKTLPKKCRDPKIFFVPCTINSKDDIVDLANLDLNSELIDLIDQVCKNDEEPECSKHGRVLVAKIEKPLRAQVETILTVEFDSANQGRDWTWAESNSDKKTDAESDLSILPRAESTSDSRNQKRVSSEFDSSMELKAKSNSNNHLRAESDSNNQSWKQLKAETDSTHQVPNPDRYAYLDNDQQIRVIIANNLHREQEEKLLQVLMQHKKVTGWRLSDLPGINPSICMHKI
ncbi:hypothetical protein CR513_17179, partial [Mucuna pruriens]